MKNFFRGLLVLLFAALIFAYGSAAAQTVHLKFIETSDVHGSLFPYDFINNKEVNSSLAQIYTYVKQQRADKNQHVILLDDGIFSKDSPWFIIIILKKRKPLRQKLWTIGKLFRNYGGKKEKKRIIKFCLAIQ